MKTMLPCTSQGCMQVVRESFATFLIGAAHEALVEDPKITPNLANVLTDRMPRATKHEMVVQPVWHANPASAVNLREASQYWDAATKRPGQSLPSLQYLVTTTSLQYLLSPPPYNTNPTTHDHL